MTTAAQNTVLRDNELSQIAVAPVAGRVTEGTDAEFRFTRFGDDSTAVRVGLWVGGLEKIMTDATEAIALTADNADLTQRLTIHGAYVDYILEFAIGETEKTLSFTTEADNVNEGDGWIGVTIVQRAGNPFAIGAGYAQVHVDDDDIPTVSISQVTLPTGAATLEGDIWVGDVNEGQADQLGRELQRELRVLPLPTQHVSERTARAHGAAPAGEPPRVLLGEQSTAREQRTRDFWQEVVAMARPELTAVSVA